MRIIVLAALAALAACAGHAPAETVAALESGLTAAERTAIGYVSLPRCPQPKNICSDPAIVQQVKDADNKAYDAIKAAEAKVQAGGSPDTAAAESALAALTTLVTSLPKPTAQ